jgi:hypothetical protein
MKSQTVQPRQVVSSRTNLEQLQLEQLPLDTARVF